MNTGTLITYLVLAAVVVVLAGFAIRQMLKGWMHRVQRQAGAVGLLPALPDTVGPAIVSATKGLYVGSTLAPSWQDRIAVGSLGFRSKAVMTRYPEGIMLQLTGGSPIWIPDESITAIRTERAIEIIYLLGHGVGGRPGKRLITRIGTSTSDGTILRCLKRRA